MFSLAVLITCHNRKEKTLNCLKVLLGGNIPTFLNIEVFLVDDGSTDGTGLAVKEYFPHINLIQGDGKLFWNRGMYLAWEHASNSKNYDFYLWLNDDTYLFKDSLNTLFHNSSLLNHNSIICGTTKSALSNSLSYGGKSKKGLIIKPDGNLQKCHFINGNVVWVPNWVFEKVGTFDNFFWHSLGDYDYGLRAKKIGIDSYIASNVIGFCEPNLNPPLWCLKEVPFFSRLKNLYSPLGNSHPYYYSVYVYRHFGLVKAIRQFLSIHLRLLFPSLWVI